MTIKSFLIFTLFFLVTSTMYTQTNKFVPHQQFYINGDATAIGNNSMSRFSKQTFNTKSGINDVIEMVYVDIDDDKSTFSSSAASLQLPEGAKIINAALYWSAVYSYNEGIKIKKRDEIVFRIADKTRDDDFNLIKLKTPTSDYYNIEGEIVYDEYQFQKFNDTSTYVCYADVTHILKEEKTINGLYTVANIKGTRGSISGGSAAGWTLFVVYELPTETLKSITTYRGLAHLFDEPLNIVVKNFKTLKQGDVKPYLTVAALEGDSKLKRDQCLVYSKTMDDYIPLQNSLRPEYNFFNSTITKHNTMVETRIPNSKNTLGFDLAEIEIPNENNILIANEDTQTTVRFISKSDRFQLFFMAFKIEINKNHKQTIIADSKFINGTTYVGGKDGIRILQKVATDSTLIVNQHKNVETKTKEEKLTILNETAGYYLITNTFSNLNLAIEWETFLKRKRHNTTIITDAVNNQHYVSVYYNKNITEAQEHLKKLENLDYFKDLWILKINLD